MDGCGQHNGIDPNSLEFVTTYAPTFDRSRGDQGLRLYCAFNHAEAIRLVTDRFCLVRNHPSPGRAHLDYSVRCSGASLSYVDNG